MVGRYRRINGLEFVQTPGDSEDPWKEEPGGLQSVESLQVRHD